MPFIEYNARKFLYLHVPRTGGGPISTWMATLAPLRFHGAAAPTCMWYTPQHMRMSDFVDLFGDRYFEHVFMTVRNPYDRIVSEYNVMARVGRLGFWRSYPTFSHWLETGLKLQSQNSFAFDNHLRPQWEFLGTGVEFMKFEHTIPAIVRHMAIKMGVADVDLTEYHQKTAAREQTVLLDRIDRLRIQEFYRKDFEVFGYDMNDYGSTQDKS